MERSIDIRQQRRRRKRKDCLQDVFLDPVAVLACSLRQYRLPSRETYSKAFHVQLRLTAWPFEPLCIPVLRKNNCEFCDTLGGQFRIACWLSFATVHLLALTLRTEVGGKGINWLCLSSRFSSCTRSLSLSRISRLQSNFCASSCNFLLFYCQYGNR